MLALVIGCGDNAGAPDAAIDAVPIDSGPLSGQPDFYGEPCSPPSTAFVASICRNDDPYPKALCTPDGICRPWCNHVHVVGAGFDSCVNVGGVETWTGPSVPGGDRGLCYCAPPR